MIGNNFIKYVSVLILITGFSCNNEKTEVKISDITNESNYEITEIKVNDSVIQIEGDNSRYKLNGYKDIKNNVKIGWWKIEDRIRNEQYEIEYISLDKNKENQIKFYKEKKLIKKFSHYYTFDYQNGGYLFKFYFPKFPNEKKEVEFDYMTKGDNDSMTSKKIECKEEINYYSCFIPVENKNQLIVGIVTEFSEIDQSNKIFLSSKSMYVRN